MKHKTYIALLLCLFLSGSICHAQRRVSADVEIKQVEKQSVTTITKSVYCSGNGRLVTCFHRPMEYVLINNAAGEARIYLPNTNQVMMDNSGSSTSRDELLTLCLMGRIDDLGLGLYGYVPEKAETVEDGLLKRTFTTKNQGLAPKVEIVYENYLPIYCAYYNAEGAVITKTYLSKYQKVGRVPVPCRNTTINYVAKGDSTIVRTIYSNLQADPADGMFDFSVPEGAQEISIKDFLKAK